MTSKSKGMRFSAKKIEFGLIPKDALVEIARVYHVGAQKYEKNNWLNDMNYSQMMEPLERHYMQWSMGNTTDPDTKCHHLSQVIWNAIALLTYELRGLGVDDRHKLPIDENFNWISGPASEMDLGMSNEELDQLRNKYSALREEHRKTQGE